MSGKGIKVNKWMSTGPCLGCDRRVPGCHGKCEEYNAWLVPVLRAREARTKDAEAETLRVNGIEKSKKRRRKWGK